MTIKRSLQFALSLVTLAVCTGTAQASQLGWWKLDETSGTTSSDGSGNGNDGTLQNMAGTEWTSGQDVGGNAADGISGLTLGSLRLLRKCHHLCEHAFAASGARRWINLPG